LINWQQISQWVYDPELIPAAIMTSTALTVNQVIGNAVEEMEVEGEKLCINKVYVCPCIVPLENTQVTMT
jgi:hypothetical protein